MQHLCGWIQEAIEVYPRGCGGTIAHSMPPHHWACESIPAGAGEPFDGTDEVTLAP